jgi:hypothetical protein
VGCASILIVQSKFQQGESKQISPYFGSIYMYLLPTRQRLEATQAARRVLGFDLTPFPALAFERFSP